MIVTEREREHEAETQAEGEAGSMHREPDGGFDPRSPGSRPGPKAGAKPLRHPGIPVLFCFVLFCFVFFKDFIYSVERVRASKQGVGGTEEEGENLKQIPCQAWSPMRGWIP